MQSLNSKHSSPIIMNSSKMLNNQISPEVSPAILSTKKPKAFKELLLSTDTLEEDRKRLSDLDTLLFPRIQDLKKTRDSLKSGEPERSQEDINFERLKNKSTMLNHYFEDGKRRVDYVIVYQKPSGHSAHKIETQEALDQRSIFEVSNTQHLLSHYDICLFHE